MRNDVPGTDWYHDFVETAFEFNLINGYGNEKFGPMGEITREQAMTMISRAMGLTGLNMQFETEETELLLSNFIDAGNASQWAKKSIAACVKAGIVSGRAGNQIVPKDNISRAEVAVIISRLLQKSDLI